jgi:hypothetical protein
MSTGTRIRRTLAAAVVTLVSVSWGASASAAPQHHKAPAHHPIVISHTMSSCGNMNGF